MRHYTDIFDYITAQESAYMQAIPINDKWRWSMKEHIKTTVMYNNSQLLTGKSDFKPVKNITRPILNLQHRTEDIEARDVQLYVNDSSKYHLSFLVKKYHDDVFVVENDMDTFFDELNVSRIDFGGGLSKKLNKPAPEVVPLESIAFCDQTDILSGPIGIKHYYSPDQLLAMEDKGWGNKENGATVSLDELITLSVSEKKAVGDNNQVTETPGRYVEVYEVHGTLPKRFATENITTGGDKEKYENRIFIVAFYQKKDSPSRTGVILYTAKEKESPFKLIKRDPIYGRALGMGGAEELFEAQVWVNYDMIRMQDMLDAAAKTILISNDPAIAQKNNLRNLENLDILDEAVNGNTRQLDTFPRNIKLFEQSVERWETHAQQMGAANDAIMGESPSSGTPFKLQELVVSTGQGLHEYRRGQYAKHLEEIYTDWIIPHIQKKICEGKKFLSELNLEELQYVTDCLVRNKTNRMKMDYVLDHAGEAPDEEMVTLFEEKTRDEFKRKGNKHFIEILKDEFKGAPLAVKVNVAGKSKNLALAADKINNVIRFVVQAGGATALGSPAIWNLINQMVEHSGMDPVDFNELAESFKKQAEQELQATQMQAQPAPAELMPQPNVV